MESAWLSHIHEQLALQDIPILLNVSWAAYHASQSPEPVNSGISVMLPLHCEKVTSPAMVKHSLDMASRTTALLCSDEMPFVMCGDQPVYALIKRVQWNWPILYGEKRCVALFGPLHIEQNFLRVLGQFLSGPGWVTVLSNSGIIPCGSAEGLLKVLIF